MLTTDNGTNEAAEASDFDVVTWACGQGWGLRTSTAVVGVAWHAPEGACSWEKPLEALAVMRRQYEAAHPREVTPDDVLAEYMRSTEGNGEATLAALMSVSMSNEIARLRNAARERGDA